ncbi:hypothetical protein SeLEV6574_g05190 [Synchytrium endobioticum]|uniref:EXS domain-containing protein n=1 Tax=Synchytrium endobioticum TaxID=286115 RepID=A0A507CVN6_9FUNG|nr:hypothetical protein SeLEV6574_g05190 [Synchytrium endobioticum]
MGTRLLLIITIIVIWTTYQSLGSAMLYIRELPLYCHVLLLVNLGLWCAATNIHILGILDIEPAVLLEATVTTSSNNSTLMLERSWSPSPLLYTPISPTINITSNYLMGNSYIPANTNKSISPSLLAQQSGWIPKDLYGLSSVFTCITILSLVAFGNAADRWGESAAVNIVSSTYALILILTILPFNVFYRSLRLKFLRSLKRIAFGTFHSEVPFSDVILADILTSFSRVFGDLQIVFWTLVMPNEESQTSEVLDQNQPYQSDVASTKLIASWTDLVAPILICSPFIFRLRQCIAEYNLSAEPAAKNRHLTNAAKYLSALPVIISSFLINWLRIRYRGIGSNQYGSSLDEMVKIESKLDFVVGIWLVSSLANSLFSLYWDVIMDWSLFRRRHRHLPAFPIFLRPILHFRKPSAYYAAIVINTVLRLAWIIKVPLLFQLVDATLKPNASGLKTEEDQIPLLVGVDLALKVAEILRRWLWHKPKRANGRMDALSGVYPIRDTSAMPWMGAALLMTFTFRLVSWEAAVLIARSSSEVNQPNSAEIMLSMACLAISAFTAWAGAATFTQPAAAPTATSTFYVGQNNGTISNGAVVPGLVFDRFVQIWLENTDYADSASSPTFQKLASKGILLTNYHAVTHPSEPNYMASVGGDFFGLGDDSMRALPQNVSTIADLLELKSISWAEYQENMPTDGFPGFNFTNPNDNYVYYVRKHNPLILYDSVAKHQSRAARIRNFNDFAVDVMAGPLSQWLFITPNLKNDGHDSDINWINAWLEYWLVPMLNVNNLNDARTLIFLTFDENESYGVDNNRVYSLLLGGVIPASAQGTTDDTFYTHYSILSTIQNNWRLGSLGRGDTNKILSNVFQFVASNTNYSGNVNVSTEQQPALNSSATYCGPFNPKCFAPVPPPNVSAVGAGGGPVFLDSSVNMNQSGPAPPTSQASLALTNSVQLVTVLTNMASWVYLA